MKTRAADLLEEIEARCRRLPAISDIPTAVTVTLVVLLVTAGIAAAAFYGT